ncbi:MAG: hypothetical protein OXF27_03715 [Acidobacteria bacterium]|nr:hypothetical protein [Acidobacteriota bacterium]
MKRFPDPSFEGADGRTAPTLAERPPIVTPADICDDAIALLEAGWIPQGALDAGGRSCNALSPRARRFSLDAAIRRAAYDLGGRHFRDRLDPGDTAGDALRALGGHLHAMLRKALPADSRELPVFDEVCDSREITLTVLQSIRHSLPEYPGLRPRTRTRRRRPGVHAFLVESEEAAILQRDGQYWRIHGFGEAGRCHAATTLSGVRRYCEIFAFAEAENTRRYRIEKRRRIARLLAADRSPDVWREVRRILENPLDPAPPAAAPPRD